MAYVSRHISLPLVFSQSYNAATDTYSETWTPAIVNLEQNKPLEIRNIVVAGYYFKTVNPLDTPVSAIIAVARANPSAYVKSLYPDFTLMGDPRTGLFETYNGSNDEILNLSIDGVNPDRPHRWGVFSAPSASYSSASSRGVLDRIPGIKTGIMTTLMIQGTSYAAPFTLDSVAQGSFLLVCPFIAGLKQTQLYAGSRVSFDLVVEED